MRVIVIHYTDGYTYDKPVIFTTPDLSDNQIQERFNKAVLEYRAELGYHNFKEADEDGWVFGSLLPEVPLRILKKYDIGLIHADAIVADYDYGFPQENKAKEVCKAYGIS